jgi:hypothetical protein
MNNVVLLLFGRMKKYPRKESEDSIAMDYENLLVERQGRMAVLRFNRPERLNALSIDLMNNIERSPRNSVKRSRPG